MTRSGGLHENVASKFTGQCLNSLRSRNQKYAVEFLDFANGSQHIPKHGESQSFSLVWLKHTCQALF
jgi:hypothetical protein